MAYLKKLQEEAKEKLPWLPHYFTVTDIQDEQVSGWIRSDIEWEFLRHIHEKETGVHFMMRHDDRARKAKQQQRFYIKHDPIPINKHPFKLYRLITYACEHKDLGPSRRRIPDHLRKKKTKMTMVEKVDCPAKIAVRKVTIYDGFVLPPKASSKIKMKVLRDLKIQLEKNHDLVPKSNWIFVTLPLECAHRNHSILKYELSDVKGRIKNKYDDEEDEDTDDDSAVSIDNDGTIIHDASGDVTFRQITAQGQVSTSSEYDIVATDNMHLGNAEGVEPTYILPECSKPNQVIMHGQEIKQADLSWIGYENEVEAAMASVVSHENDGSVVDSRYDPNDHITTVTVVTDMPVENVDNQQEMKVTSVSVKAVKEEHQTPKPIRTSKSQRTSPMIKSHARQANMLATEKRVYTNLCIMNITSTIEILKKFKDIVPNCVDENVVETIAGIRKKLNELYDKCKYNKVSVDMKEERRIQTESYSKMNEESINRKRKSATIKLQNSFADEGRMFKKRRRSQISEPDVHTLMPAAIIHHHDAAPITLERHESGIITPMHQDTHHQDVTHLQHGTASTSNNTVPLSLPAPAPAHQNYQIHQNFHTSNGMMNVWIHQQ